MNSTGWRILACATAIFALVAAGCGGSEGPAGPAGKDGTAGKNGAAGSNGTAGKDGVNGDAGANGKDGTSCTVVDNHDGTSTVTCGTAKVTITSGKDGASCSAVDNGDGTNTITCGTTSVNVANGKDGTSCTVADNGDGTSTVTCGTATTVISNGKDGTSCTAVDNGDGTKTITCGATTVTVADGAAGTGCTAVDNGDGTKTITCGTTAVTVANGTNGSNGTNCSAVDNGDGTKTITCGATTVTVADGKTGTGCTAVDNGDGTKTITCGTSTVTVANGTNAKDTGVVNGTLTADIGPAPNNVSVTTTPNVGVTAFSNSSGAFTMTLPIGTYVINFSSSGYNSQSLAAITVTGGSTTPVSAKLTAKNPLVLTAPTFAAPVGFGAPAQLDVTVTGGTTPYTYAWTAKTTPTTETLSNAAIKNPTFTTGTLANVIAGGKVTGLFNLTRKNFVPVTNNQLKYMNYIYTVMVTDSVGFTKSLDVTVPTATLALGHSHVPRNAIVIANLPGNASAATFTKPAGSGAVLHEDSTVNPWFIPDVAGDYTVGGLAVNVADYTSASQTCSGCHNISPPLKAAVDAKWHDWNNSAHGNYFFKQMGYDGTGALVWLNDENGNPLPGPTGATAEVYDDFNGNLKYDKGEPFIDANNNGVYDYATNWTTPGAMPLFQFGMEGGEGSHYSATCLQCHTTGYNLLAANGGFDDVAASAGWTFPTLTQMQAAFGGDAVTTVPKTSLYSAIPAGVVKFGGIQCESCHGPLGNHVVDGSNKPVAEYGVGACGYCHDAPTHHDKVPLWQMSKHATLSTAQNESTVELRGTGLNSCGRCHSAQGFVAYQANMATDQTKIVRPTTLTPIPFSLPYGNPSTPPVGGCTPAAANNGPNDAYDPACPCKTSGYSTCNATGWYCTPAAGHLNSADTYDPNCPAKPNVVAGPHQDNVNCTVNGDCAGVAGVTGGSTCLGTAPTKTCTTCSIDADCTAKMAGGICVVSASSAKCSFPPVDCLVDADCGAFAGSICVNKACAWTGAVADKPFYDYLNGLGANTDNVEPQTCAACHDPHTTTLRADGDTGPLPNGGCATYSPTTCTAPVVQMQGAGAGAICMKCHNSRNGAFGDYVSTTAGVGNAVSAPHEAIQTDIFLGVNAYYMGAGGMTSKHAAVEDTCVGCHVKLHPDSLTVANTNHTFEADGTICKNCHGEAGVGLEALEGQFMVARGNLEKAIATAFNGVMCTTPPCTAATQDYWMMAINQTPDAGNTVCTTPMCSRMQLCDNTTNPGTPTCVNKYALVEIKTPAVGIVPSGRSQNLTITFAASPTVNNPFGAGTVASLTGNMFNVLAGAAAPKVNPSNNNFVSSTLTKSGTIAKTNSNYWLVSSTAVDEEGNPKPWADVVHNPSFVFTVLTNTQNALLGAFVK